MRSHTLTIVLSGGDIIAATVGLRKYLMMDEGIGIREYRASDYKKGQNFRGEGINLIWYDNQNHGEIFDTSNDMEAIVSIAHRYCNGPT